MNSYDQLKYRSTCVPAASLDNLAIQGMLAGLTPNRIDNCRVLEIGCAGGGNLLPMAAMFPDSSFVGFDLSQTQVQQAADIANRADLLNVRFMVEDIRTFEDEGQFDYIIAHGMYSWVPSGVRDSLMNLIHRHLAPAGIAYLCFNALPGFRLKQITRDMMRFHGRNAQTVDERVTRGREILALAAASALQQKTPYLTATRSLIPEVLANADWLLAHDDLEETCEPVYLHEFVAHAASHGLAYLGGALPPSNLARIMTPDIREKLAAHCHTAIDLEQYCDFIFGTRYRDAILTRNQSAPAVQPDFQAVKRMLFAAKLTESAVGSTPVGEGSVRFVNSATLGAATLHDSALVTLLRHLDKHWPHAVSFQELCSIAKQSSPGREDVEDFVAYSLHALYCNNVLELWSRPTSFIATGQARPCVTKLARIQAGMGGPLASLRHKEFLPVDPFIQKMVPLMDGTRDREQLASLLLQSLEAKEFGLMTPNGPVSSASDVRTFMTQALAVLESKSMFVAG